MNMLRRHVASCLSSLLVLTPMLALSDVVTPRVLATAAATPQPITRNHRAQELLIKFRANAQRQLRDAVIQAFIKNTKKLKGRSATEKLTIKDNLDLANTLFNIRQLNQVVEWVEPNYIVTKNTQSQVPNDPDFNEQWSLRNSGQNGGVSGADIGVEIGWGTNTGSRQTIIAVIDSGIDTTHPDLRMNLWRNSLEGSGPSGSDDDGNGYVDDVRGWNFVNDTNNVTDDHGHGTLVSGLIAAEGNNAAGITGVMWQASIMPLKALDSAANGTIANVVEAIDYAAQNHAAVINCSFGGGGYSNAMYEAIERAAIAGAIVVAAGGNFGEDIALSPHYPAGYHVGNLVSVAATTNTDALASFSNWNSNDIHLGAPGVDLRSTQIAGGYGSISGTSASAPLVSGVAGLLKTIRPWVSGETVKLSLIAGVRPSTHMTGKVSSGGILNIAGAIEALESGAHDVPNGGSGGGSGSSGGGGTDIDSLRAHRPGRPVPGVSGSSLPGPGYDDPIPTVSANFSQYYSSLTGVTNATGIAGSLPMQIADPTAETASVGGISINLESGNFNFTAPVMSLAGRAGLGLSLSLSYNSRVWAKHTKYVGQEDQSTMFFNSDKGFPGPGWRIGFGAIQTLDGSNPYSSSTSSRPSVLYIAPDGTRHELSYNSSTARYEAYDSSYLDFSWSSRILRTTNGTQITFGETTSNGDHQFLPTQVRDRNGNLISVSYRSLDNGDRVIDYIIDTAGRRIDFYYQSNRLLEVRQNRAGTWFKLIVLDYQPVTMQPLFMNQIDPVTITGQQVYLPSRMTYPNGQNLRFAYTKFGQMYLVEKWVPTVAGQGVERRVAYTRFNLDPNEQSPQGDCPRFTHRFEQAENWQGGYEVGFQYIGPYPGYDVTTPVGIYYRQSRSGMTQTMLTYAPGSDNPARTQQTDWIDDGLSYRSNPRVVETRVFDSGNLKKTRFSYVATNGIQLLENTDKYEGSSGVYTRTTTEYVHYPSTRILGLPSVVSVYAGAGSVLLSRIQNSYDETGSYTDSNGVAAPYFIDASGEGVVQHDASYGPSFTQRGNLTSVTQYSVVGGSASSPRIVRRVSYDTSGNIRGESDGAGNRTQVSFTDNYLNKPGGTGQTHVYPYTSQDPTGLRNGLQYDYYSGNSLKTFVLRAGSSTEEQVVTTTYDFADRPLVTTRPDTGSTSLVYYDSLLGLATFTKFDRINGVDQVKYALKLYDGAGRAFRNCADHPDGLSGKYSGQQVVFDQLGRKIDVSNIIAINSDWTPRDEDLPPAGSGWVFSNLSYDEMQRLKLITLPDGNTRQYQYSGCGCAGGLETTTIDEVGHKTITTADAMGRLAQVVEPDLSVFNGIGSKVEYIYNQLDQLLEIRHSDAVGKMQIRSFAYDGYARKISETTPEAGTVTFTYTANDQIATSTDARGKTVTYAYNTRKLVTSIGYNDGGATPGAAYTYDEFGARLTMTDGEGATTYVYDNFRRLQSEARTFTGLAGITYALNYSYNYAGQVTKVNYVAGNAGGSGGVGGSALYTISGSTKTAANDPIAGATITMTGGQARVATTDATGGYWFFNVPSGSTYYLTPTKTGYSFSPSMTTFFNLNSNKTANFTGTPNPTPTPTPTPSPQPTPTPPPPATAFNKVVNYKYNSAGALSGVGTDWTGTDPNSTTNVLNATSYRAFGALKQASYGNGRRLRLGYTNSRHQLSSMIVDQADGSDPIVNYAYQYGVYDTELGMWRNNGRITKITDNVDAAYTVNYTYDDFERLTSAQAGAYTRSYTFDRWGNLKTLAGTGGEVSGYTLNYATNGSGAPATNQIVNVNGTIPVTHDAAGNMTSEGSATFSYDAASRLKEVGSGGQNVYGYDGDGRRVRSVSSGGTPLHYVWSSILGEVAYEAMTGDSAVRAYVYAGKKQIALRGTDRGFYFVHSDHLGSLKKLTRTNGTVAYRVEYDPHGQRVMEWSDVSTSLSSHKFTGHEYDSGTGLEYAKARMLNHNRGRFMQADPAGLTSSESIAPGSLNLYSYVRNDGANYIDETGEFASPPRPYIETRFPPDATQPIWEPEPPEKVTREDDGSGGGVLLDAKTDCQRFVEMVQAIADAASGHEDFMDRMARAFTAANNSSMREMFTSGANVLPPDRVAFSNTPSGFKSQFIDGNSNQVRHFVGGLVAGYRLGYVAGWAVMRQRESADRDMADIVLNEFSVTLGAFSIRTHTTTGIPIEPNYRQLSGTIKAGLCD